MTVGSVATILLVLVPLAVILQRRITTGSKGSRLPPGPPGKLLVGNALDIPPQASWTWYHELKNSYG